MNQNLNWDLLIQDKIKKTGGFFNIAHEILDHKKHAGEMTLTFLKKDSTQRLSLNELRMNSLKFSRALKKAGLKEGEVIFSLLPRTEALLTTLFGALRAGMIFSPLFSSFGPDPILTRIKEGRGKVLVTLSSFYFQKISVIRDLLDLKLLLIIDDDGNGCKIQGSREFSDFYKNEEDSFYLVKTRPTDPALLHFTSGTTGKPKGVLHAHQSLIYHEYSARLALGLERGKRYWCTADPGWVTGMSYGVLAPLIHQAEIFVDEADFQAERWLQILADNKIEIWYTSPTALRMLMRSEELIKNYSFPYLQVVASVGEPLNPEIIRWGEKFLGVAILDNWWQTETGGIMIANCPGKKVKLGSMGKALPGIEIKILNEQIAIKKNWPSMFRTYLNQDERYQKSFQGEWYLSGDRARMDEDGYFWFIGRMDDLIKTSGHLVGPFELESLLMEHPAVLEAAVIGLPDPLAGEIIKAYVTLRSGFGEGQELKREILSFIRKKAGPSISPREIEFQHNLPKTRSGKMMRRLLRARELGLPEGDLSTLEGRQ